MEDARPAVADDLAELLRLARALRAELRELRGGALWETREAAPEPLEEVFRDLLTRADAHVVVGTVGGAPVGFGTVVVERLRDGRLLGIVRDLYVEPEARAVGVGESIGDRLVAFCSTAGCIGIDAVALPGQRDAKNFFERAGFTARALIMHKPL